MESKHTPGPWKYIHQAHCTKPSGLGQRYAVMANVIDYLHRPEERWLFNIKLDRTADLDLHREAEANARLIAAAPDLLEALQQLVNVPSIDIAHQELRVKAIEAINKALIPLSSTQG
jgi:hypothetical protein